MAGQGKNVLGPGNSKCKGPEVDATLGETQKGRAVWEEVKQLMPGWKELVDTPGKREVIRGPGTTPGFV